jgi:hypothetical protein
MKIEISKGEYKVLLQILEMADWVLTAHKTKEDVRHKPYRRLEQKIFALAEVMGYGSYIEYSKTLQEYLPTRKYEDTCSAMRFIEEFENDSFWDELIDRLAERDAIREVGEPGFKALKIADRIMKVEEHKAKYFDEFEKHGLDRIIIAEVGQGNNKI